MFRRWYSLVKLCCVSTGHWSPTSYWSVCLSVSQSVFSQSVSRPVCFQSVCLSVFLQSVSHSVCLFSISHSVCFQSVCLSVFLQSVCLSVCLSVRLSVFSQSVSLSQREHVLCYMLPLFYHIYHQTADHFMVLEQRLFTTVLPLWI